MIINDLSAAAKNDTAVALGFFDGLHLGHMAVIQKAVLCKRNSLTPCVFTFSENPLNVLGKNAPERIMTNNDKHQFLEKNGVDLLYSIDFNEVMNLSDADFVDRILVKTLRAKKVFCGFNYHFGKGGRSDSKKLASLCKSRGIDVTELPPVMYGGAPISSTRIRQALTEGDVKTAAKMLGREFSYKFTVIKGNQIGRTLSAPTLNQQMPNDFILPKKGVYASFTEIADSLLPSVTNIGFRPTVGSDVPLSETWIPDYDCGNLYGKKVRVSLLEFLRDEKKFSSLEELQNTIHIDGENAKTIFLAKKEGLQTSCL